MKTKLKEEIQQIIYLIENNNFNIRDFKILLIDLRVFLKNGDQIKDIANFVAHPDNRDKGETVIYLEKFMDSVINTFINGGKMAVKGSIYSQEEIIKNLILDLQSYNLNIREDLFKKVMDKIMSYILDIVEDTAIQLKNLHIARSHLTKINVEKDKKTIAFCVNLVGMPENGVIKLNGKSTVTICFPAFEANIIDA